MKAYKSIFILFLLGVMLGSCSDFFEPGNINQNLSDRFTYDPNYSEGLLLNGYSGLNVDYRFTETGTDDAVSNLTSDGYRRMASGEWSSKYNPVEEWTDAYRRLYYLNLFLQVVDKTTWFYVPADLDPNKDSASIVNYTKKNDFYIIKHKAEALALRAIYNFQLLQGHAGRDVNGTLWGAPLVTKPLRVEDNWKLSRDSFSVCLNSIYADLDSAIANLPARYGVWDNKFNKYKHSSNDSMSWRHVFGVENLNRIDATIAKALKAKVSLFAASPAFESNQSNWEKAAALNGEMIKGFTTTSFPADGVFYDADTDISNTDILWRYDWKLALTMETAHFPPTKLGNGNVNPTQNFVDAFPMKNGYPIDSLTLSGYDATKPYTNRDPRLQKFVVYNGNDINGTVINTVDTTLYKDGLNQSQYATRTGYYLKKLLRADVNLTTGTTKRHFVTLIRYTELFLNYAEAANEAYGPDGTAPGITWTPKEVLRSIRKRAGITQPDAYLNSLTSKDDIRKLIQNERRIELSFEGFRFWDMRRWMMPLNESAKGMRIKGVSPNFTYSIFEVETRNYVTPQMYYGPIPYKELLKDGLLIQNLGW